MNGPKGQVSRTPEFVSTADPADAGRQALDGARGERLVDERAEPGVVGRLVNSRF